MNIHEVNDHGASGQLARQAKKPWVTPSLQVIAIASAENGINLSKVDGTSGSHSNQPRS
jgi:hypothetical protein